MQWMRLAVRKQCESKAGMGARVQCVESAKGLAGWTGVGERKRRKTRKTRNGKLPECARCRG